MQARGGIINIIQIMSVVNISNIEVRNPKDMFSSAIRL